MALSYPSAVRSPYLSAYLPGYQVANLLRSSAQFWTGSQGFNRDPNDQGADTGNILRWSVTARVDDTAHDLFGVYNEPSSRRVATVLSAEYTVTHSVFNMSTGSPKITLDFFSPVYPSDYVRQSMPFSCLTISVECIRCNSQAYSDIDDTWAGQKVR